MIPTSTEAKSMSEIHPTNPEPAPRGPQPQPHQQAVDWTTVPENPREDPRHMDNIRAEIKKAFPDITDEEIDLQMI